MLHFFLLPFKLASVSLTDAVYKAQIGVMLISVHVYSKVPWKQMMSFSLWFPVSLLSRELSVAFALCTRCKKLNSVLTLYQVVDGSQPTEEARLLCPRQCSPRAASHWFYQQQLDPLPQGQWLKEWMTSFLVTPINKNQQGFLRGIFFMTYY